ncbi:MAG: hypothetical protein HS111_12430 [Kofleriaceae bacterium]|nr:hypothetical protein [Kofleriaceae bacterium]
MEQEQTNLRTNFRCSRRCSTATRSGTGEQLDYRAAVTTTGVTASGTQVLPPPFSTSLPFNQTGQDGRSARCRA